MTKWLRAALALLVSLALAACGGGSDAGNSLFGGNGSGGGGTTAATATDLVLVLDKTVVSNTGTETVTATAYALDANRSPVANVPVTFRPDATAISSTPSGTRTNDQGIVTSTISLGNNLTNRTVTVAVSAGNLVRSATFVVAGTSGGPSGQSANDLVVLLDKTIVSNSGQEKVTATVIALDTNRNAMSGIPVTVNVNADAIATIIDNRTTTGSTGTLTADVTLGKNLTNRSVTVTATSGAIVRTAVFQVANSSGTTQTVQDVQIKLSTASVDNSGTQNVVATVTALDANGKGMSGVPIVLAVDKNATYSFTGTSAGTTGEDGTVVANITIGNDLSIRTINVSATGGTVTKATSFAVTGTRQVASDLSLALSSSSIQNSLNNSVIATITAVDANRNVLSNIPVALTVDNGANITPSARVTDAAGKITAKVDIGADRTNRIIRVTATSGSVTRVANLEVRGASLSGQASVATLQTGASGRITYLLVDNAGSKMGNIAITITAAGLADVTGTTDSNGEYVYNYNAPAVPGTLIINALAAGAPTSTTITVQSPTAPVVIPDAAVDVASPSISVNPNVVAVNAPGATTTNKVEVRALFLSANNAPVQNVRVWFDLNGDKQTIGGTLDSAKSTTKTFLYTDANGVARTSYAPGIRLSPKDGVTIRACWSKVDFPIPADGGACPNAVTTTLTVISEALSVSIGTNGTIEIGPSGLTYVKRFAVQVVDSAGQAKADALVAPSIDLVEYYKGSWELPQGTNKWVRGGYGNSYPATYPSGATVPYGVAADLPSVAPAGSASALWLPQSAVPPNGAAVCANEDLNRNGVAETYLDQYERVLVSEDVNGSATLNPQRPALDPRKADITVTTVGSPTTNADGIVVVKIEYPQNLASWVKFNLLVSASGVAGTEGRANYVDLLPVEPLAVVNTNATPAFRNSPYGTVGSPTYPRKNAFGQAGFMCSDPN